MFVGKEGASYRELEFVFCAWALGLSVCMLMFGGVPGYVANWIYC